MALGVECHKSCFSRNIAGIIHNAYINRTWTHADVSPKNGESMCISTSTKPEPHLNPPASEEEV